MRLQKKIWEDEHADNRAIPALADSEPSSQLLAFIDYLESKKIKINGSAIDIGSGKGRNAVYLASLGYKVFGLEYIEAAVKASQQLAKDKGVFKETHFILGEIDSPWPFEDSYFDLAIDCFSSIDVETKLGREKCRDEMFRTLKPGAYAMVAVVSANDEWESKAIVNHPGKEPNSSYWSQNGKFQKDYDEDELRRYLSKFEVIEVREIKKPAEKLGVKGVATNLLAIIKKPV